MVFNDGLPRDGLDAEVNFPPDCLLWQFEIPTLITDFFEEYSFGSDVCDKVTIHWWQIFQVDSRQYGTCLFFDVFCIKTEACHKDRHLPYWHYIPGQSLGVLLLQNMCFSCSNDGHFHQLHFSSSLILVECSYCHTILLRWCRS